MAAFEHRFAIEQRVAARSLCSTGDLTGTLIPLIGGTLSALGVGSEEVNRA